MQGRRRGNRIQVLGTVLILCAAPGCFPPAFLVGGPQRNPDAKAPNTKNSNPAAKVELLNPRSLEPRGEVSELGPWRTAASGGYAPSSDVIPVAHRSTSSNWGSGPLSGSPPFVLAGTVPSPDRTKMLGKEGDPFSPTNQEGDTELPRPRRVNKGHSGSPPARHVPVGTPVGTDPPVPRELAKKALPAYLIEPPDILLVEAVGGEGLLKIAQPIRGPHLVRPDGTISLGIYGSIFVGGYTLDQAREAIAHHLRTQIVYKAQGEIAVVLSQPSPVEIPKGTTITVGGMEFITDQKYRASEAGGAGKILLEKQEGQNTWMFPLPVSAKEPGASGNVRRSTSASLSQEPPNFVKAYVLEDFTGGGAFDIRDLNVDVLAYNSKFYYVITDGGGYGEQVYPFPITGSETVLDAIGRINGLPMVADKRHVWVARRGPGDCGMILPVDWNGIAQRGGAATNFQLIPGDRIYVKADHWIAADSWIGKRLSPFERVFGATLLGSEMINSISGRNSRNN